MGDIALRGWMRNTPPGSLRADFILSQHSAETSNQTHHRNFAVVISFD
jgi:hypothetical protein